MKINSKTTGKKGKITATSKFNTEKEKSLHKLWNFMERKFRIQYIFIYMLQQQTTDHDFITNKIYKYTCAVQTMFNTINLKQIFTPVILQLCRVNVTEAWMKMIINLKSNNETANSSKHIGQKKTNDFYSNQTKQDKSESLTTQHTPLITSKRNKEHRVLVKYYIWNSLHIQEIRKICMYVIIRNMTKNKLGCLIYAALLSSQALDVSNSRSGQYL